MTGLITYDASGNVRFNSDDVHGRIFGVANIPKNVLSGTIVDARFTQATPFFFHTQFYTSPWEMTISVSGNTLSWSRSGGSNSLTDIWTRIYYGTYA